MLTNLIIIYVDPSAIVSSPIVAVLYSLALSTIPQQINKSTNQHQHDHSQSGEARLLPREWLPQTHSRRARPRNTHPATAVDTRSPHLAPRERQMDALFRSHGRRDTPAHAHREVRRLPRPIPRACLWREIGGDSGAAGGTGIHPFLSILSYPKSYKYGYIQY
jgi:hypothetical protein